MTELDFAERLRLWRLLKPLLLRSLGDQGAAAWLRCAARQIERDAPRRVARIETFPIDPASPEAML